ncbi:hypothetical protein [Oscillatoria sp. FACHB-1406]|uniref:hypothetical protein n=1 Tax=Oscillatoria sp. FACHB-1406 TaxID=2692846 RepID=UPI001689D78A|nr:hypothetical protein [Oscillatoria sp. FACHB-1406]MBD2577688.1 hypothetical protein [Oscillatoria sp. FACHB-1406]
MKPSPDKRLAAPPSVVPQRLNPPKSKKSLLGLLLRFAIALYGLSVLGSLIW